MNRLRNQHAHTHVLKRASKMTYANLKKHISKFKWRGLQNIRADQDGVSAIEFALIAPLMVVLFFGGIEISLLMQADRRVTTVASTIGDLASRETILNNGDIDDIFLASTILLSPLDPSIAEVRLTSLIADASGDVTVDWSDGCNLEGRMPGESVDDLPEGIIAPNGSIIMAEISYEYDSEIAFTLQNTLTLSDRFFLRPRRSDTVERDTTDSSSGASNCADLSGTVGGGTPPTAP